MFYIMISWRYFLVLGEISLMFYLYFINDSAIFQ